MLKDSTSKTTIKIFPATAMQEGAGASVRRLFPTQHVRHLDPFVVFDEFSVALPAGFPDHPHRGFEAVTYMLDGAFHHRDNLGNDSIVGAGGAQRFTAGSGLVHSEMPGSAETAHGIQLWINLPQSLKQLPPAYQAVQAEDILEVEFDYGRVRHIVGDGGPVTLHTDVRYLDLQFEAPGQWVLDVPADKIGLVYSIGPHVQLDTHALDDGYAAYAGPGSYGLMGEADSRAIVLVAAPHHEPIRQWGPYVD